ncbi:hypothetical protein D9611_014528 [Ephemerocybe angulata]|uniref:aspartyl aminopeptidase n=1 Tax=Ephemerocybe angulata TaxID=980116 RepID=A0A8H5C9R6_9AGAR|nr:hypothetical protein D9611_014528 [Tulosesus angulatus]
MLYPAAPEAATRFLKFVNASPTPFHAVHNAAIRLESVGFKKPRDKIREKDEWEKELVPGGKYYFTRNQAALVAFTLPQKWKQGAGLSIVATHVDSPNLKVRPISKRTKQGYLQVGVETYGGGIWHSWLDRDLSIAGRVVISQGNGSFQSKLVKIDQPILRVPTLAIHLDRGVNDNLKFNQETEFVPILGLLEGQLNATKSEDKEKFPERPKVASSVQENHHPQLLQLLAGELSVAPEEIHDFELSLYDTQPSVLGGINNEFVFSPRLDNLVSSFCAVEAIAESVQANYFPTLEGNVNCIALFNHEEIGSSFLISADMGHAVHPNYTSKHEEKHRPVMNGGIAIKTNAKQRYASDAIGSFIVKQLVERKGGKVQEFEVRNDISSTNLRFAGLVVLQSGQCCPNLVSAPWMGNPMLSMHSIRETAGSHDIQHAIDLFQSFFEGFVALDKELTVD